MAGLFGASPSDFYQGSQWMNEFGNDVNYNPAKYNMFNAAAYGGGMGSNYENSVNTQLSGQLSPAVLAELQQSFGSNLQAAKAGSYGAPVGAQSYNQMQVAGDTALKGALLGEQQIQAGQSAALPYLQLGQNENQFAGSLGEKQSEFGTNLNLAKAQYAGNLTQDAYKQSAQTPSIFGQLIGAATNWGLGKLFPAQQGNNPAPQVNTNTMPGVAY